ncbi:MAG TPA: outer membrane lipoprotein carrier protein LolA [Oceanospirillales bacterium]|nr:outer membrane lipoprotein carrier protein LolA [Oceanospirillaceae bacterium]HBS42975.1 outer membrane lipoprotein carrier protein LolA [Oceanospirillales bacterium]|tara:strand:+ start:22018 stop:22653 length:636 start_codon:yes stop_codon:yes gene_type:complete
MNIFRQGLLVLSLGLTSCLVQANTSLDHFIGHLEKVTDMEAGFTQVTADPSGNVLQSLSGTLTVARPGKMRWQTNPPYEQLVVSDGKVVWIYDMDLEQVSIRELEQRLQDTPALLLSGDTSEISANYVVSETQTGSTDRYQLIPKDNSQLFDYLEFDYRGDRLSAMRIFDATGQITEITFSGMQINQGTDSAAFQFDIPEGVDVIDGRHGR